MRLFHIATSADWQAAQRSGRYTISTRGRSLAEEGYIHACRADQWQGVRERFYADVDEPLVLLVIDADRLDVPVVDESPPGSAPGAETFPHLYGALDPAAVVQVLPLGTGTEPRAPGADGASFSRLFFGEMFHNIGLVLLVMATVAAGVLLGEQTGWAVGSLLGLLVGLLVGVPAAVALHRRRRQRLG